MKHFILLLLALFSLTACGTYYRASREANPTWEGRTTSEILRAMGDPDRIDADGRGGSILVYESAPDYNSPDYDILAPEAGSVPRRFAKFYLDSEGRCYRVDTNRNLPAPSRYDRSSVAVGFWLDLLWSLPLLTILVLI